MFFSVSRMQYWTRRRRFLLPGRELPRFHEGKFEFETTSGDPAPHEALQGKAYAVAFQGAMPVRFDLKGRFHVAFI